MRLLLISDHYPPFIGGAERQTQRLAARFAAAGHEVQVAVPCVKGLPRVVDEDGVRINRIRQVRTLFARGDAHTHPPPYPDPLTAFELRRLVRNFEPHLVHAQGWISYSVAVALLGNKTPLLISARDYGYFCANRTLLHQGRPCSGPALAKCLACAGDYYGRPKGWVATVGVFASAPLLRRKVTAAHSISRFVSAEMRRHFLKTASGRREVVIPSFRDESDRGSESANGALAQLPSKPFILYVGQFRRAKGLEVLFEAYEKLTAPPPLVLIGSQNWDGPEELPGYATVLRSLPHEAVMEAWDRAAFGVMPSLWPEPFGSVVHEAMSRGKAVVGTSHGGHPDMIRDGESGLLVPPGDSTALRAAMQRLLDEAELRDRLGAAARERARLFDAENVIPRFAELYESLAVREST